MGQEMGSQLGKVLDVGIYEFPEKAKIVKIKVLIDINLPIRAGMYIGNDDDGINWVDFRFENLPMFCFGCGLIGHNVEHCRNQPIPLEGGINPRGAWLRTKNYGRRVIERKEKTFSSNPLKSISGGPYSPIPKGLIDQMAAMKLRKSSSPNFHQATYQTHQQHVNTKFSSGPQDNLQMATQQQHHLLVTPHQQRNSNSTGQKFTKRKLDSKEGFEAAAGKDLLQDTLLAGLENKASQQP